jgi:hypothetical protein
MRIVVTGVDRRAVADVDVADGAFDLAIAQTIDYGAYTEIALYVDEDLNDICSASEPLWGLVTGIVQENLLLEVTPDKVCVNGGGPRVGVGCRSWPRLSGTCFVNGQTDLTTGLPCPP